MYQGIRLSCTRTVAVGKKNADWSKQSTRFISPITGEAKKVRRKCLRNQVLMSDFDVKAGITINLVEKIRVPIERKDGTMGEAEKMVGYVDGRRVIRDGYAYSHVTNGVTPGRWRYA